MIKVTVQYNDHLVDIHFPCSENTLQSALMEIHAADDNPPELFIKDVVFPEELDHLKDRFVNLDELNYLAKRMESFFGTEEEQFYIVPNGVTSIGKSAFDSCNHLTEIAIPDSVTSIGEFAFSQCVSLTAVRLPHKLKELNDYTFSRCTKLKTVELPNSLRKIKMWAFQDCESLSQITFPEKLKTIGWQAFHGCKSLEKVILPPEVKTSRNSFDEHTAVVIPEAASAAGTPAAQDIIEKKAFAGSDITSLEVEEGIKKIKEQAYKDCKALKTVSLPRSLTDLGAGVFDGCQMLSSVTYHGNSLIKIGKNAFRGTKFEKEYIKDIESTSSPCTLSEKTMVCLGSTLKY